MIKVSICIPTYQNVNGFKRLMDSIIIQTFTDFEIIITDDSPDDKIENEINNYANMEISYYRNNPRKGAAGNWNEAISHARGQYIKIMHHDDWFTYEDSLNDFVEMLDKHPEAVMAFCGTSQVSENESYQRYIADMDVCLLKEDYRNLYLGNTIGAPSAVIHRRTDAQYDLNLSWLIDSEFYMGLLKENPNFIYTKKDLISIGISNTQLTNSCIENSDLISFEYGYVFQKHNLKVKKEYQKKIITVFLDNKKSFGDIKKYSISSFLYVGIFVKKTLSKIKYKLTHINLKRDKK